MPGSTVGIAATASILNDAVRICEKYPDKLPYIDKKCEHLTRHMIGVDAVFLEVNRDAELLEQQAAERGVSAEEIVTQAIRKMIERSVENAGE